LEWSCSYRDRYLRRVGFNRTFLRASERSSTSLDQAGNKGPHHHPRTWAGDKKTIFSYKSSSWFMSNHGLRILSRFNRRKLFRHEKWGGPTATSIQNLFGTLKFNIGGRSQADRCAVALQPGSSAEPYLPPPLGLLEHGFPFSDILAELAAKFATRSRNI